MTHRRPFPRDGNGYFANWVALLTSVSATIQCMPKVNDYFEKMARGGAILIPLLFIASCAVLIESAVKCSNVGNFPLTECGAGGGFIMAISAIGAVLSLLLHFPPAGRSIMSCFKYYAAFLNVVWAAGAIISTFGAPYTTTEQANGYYGSWTAFAACLFLLDGSLSWNTVQANGPASLIAGTNAELLALFIGSVNVAIAGGLKCQTDQERHYYFYAWSTAVGTFSSIGTLALVALRLRQSNPETLDCRMKIISRMLGLFWMSAFGCFTYRRPFNEPGNGFYGCWVSLLASGLLIARYCPPFRLVMERAAAQNTLDMLTMWAASILLVIQLAVDQAYNELIPYGPRWGWGIVICGYTCLCLIAIHLDNLFFKKDLGVKIAMSLLAGWAAAAGVLTFDNGFPFTKAGNGYWAIWMGFLGAARFTRHNFFLTPEGKPIEVIVETEPLTVYVDKEVEKIVKEVQIVEKVIEKEAPKPKMRAQGIQTEELMKLVEEPPQAFFQEPAFREVEV